jgi:hypothetical protein
VQPNSSARHWARSPRTPQMPRAFARHRGYSSMKRRERASRGRSAAHTPQYDS